MKGTTKAIYDTLSGDSALLAKLASNAPYYDPNGTSETVNSIVPSDMVTRIIATPFLMVQEGSELSIGSKLIAESVFIRCYNDKRKSFVEINEIMDAVKALLDGAEITLSDKRLVKIKWEITLPALSDEPLDMKFKEQRYRILVI